MIILTIVIDETDKFLSTEGIVAALANASKREAGLANGLLKAIEDYCMTNRGVDGSFFRRRDLPSAITEDGESLQSD